MAKKIVMKVQMNCPKCKAKALRVASQADGVSYLGFDGEENLVVIGEGVDATNIVEQLRTKVGNTKLISVADHKGSQ